MCSRKYLLVFSLSNGIVAELAAVRAAPSAVIPGGRPPGSRDGRGSRIFEQLVDFGRAVEVLPGPTGSGDVQVGHLWVSR